MDLIERTFSGHHWVFDLLPMRDALHPQWRDVRRAVDGCAYENRTLGLFVIVSGSVERDGQRWLHVSVSREKRIPSYDDLALVKRVFVGRDRAAFQVFAPAAQHVNLHPYVLHLFSPIDHYPLPDFTRDSKSL